MAHEEQCAQEADLVGESTLEGLNDVPVPVKISGVSDRVVDPVRRLGQAVDLVEQAFEQSNGGGEMIVCDPVGGVAGAVGQGVAATFVGLVVGSVEDRRIQRLNGVAQVARQALPELWGHAGVARKRIDSQGVNNACHYDAEDVEVPVAIGSEDDVVPGDAASNSLAASPSSNVSVT